MDTAQRVSAIRQQLTQQLTPTLLEIIDQSDRHKGHAGAKHGGHFKIKIAAPCFQDKSMIESHRLIYTALSNLMQTDIHALSIEIIKNHA